MSTTNNTSIRRNTIRNTLAYSFSEHLPGSESSVGSNLNILMTNATFNTLFMSQRQVEVPALHEAQIEIIDEIYSRFGIYNNMVNPERSPFSEVPGSRLRWDQMESGDIVEAIIDINGQPRNYFFCVIDNAADNLVTYPRIKTEVFPRVRLVKGYKLDFNKFSESTRESILADSDVFNYEYLGSDLDTTILDGARYNIPGLLQVGDISFLVSPTQISFTTQNGWQYFPTIRTQGNPKIPTMQEIKQVNVSLIFPNADSINNQLLPLFAMYKRAPFVNIYNKDICNFFSEIKDKENDYLAVALESLSVQSIEGYPNTVQANITFLPFQREALGTSFKALQNFDGVQYESFKRAITNDTLDADIAATESRLYNREMRYERQIMDHAVTTTSDFAKSEPFRTYYQALLSYRDTVCDEQGREVYKTSSSRGRQNMPLDHFRPTKTTSYINRYVPEENNKAFSFKYRYIPENITDFNKQLRDARRAAGEELAEVTRSFYDIIEASNGSEFRDRLTTTFFNRDNLYDSLKASLSTFDDFIVDYSNMYGIRLDMPAVRDVFNATNLLMELATFGKWEPTERTTEALNEILEKYEDGVYRTGLIQQDQIDILRGLNFWDQSQLRRQTGPQLLESIGNQIMSGIQNISDQADSESGVSQRRLVTEFFDNLYKVVTSSSDMIDLTTLEFGNNYLLTSAASSVETIEIDNTNDIVSGWGITFSNKFIPMYLSSFKYPFYQHIGSDDVNVSLSIISLQNNREIGLKEKLSQLNDRLQNTTKIILQQKPELIHVFDMSLMVNTPGTGDIFKCFGIHKAVYNNSNVSSIKGKPNAWSINVNLTQDNFTLKDYQSIARYENNLTFEDEIINLLLRAKFNTETQEIEIRDLQINMDFLRNQIAELGTDPSRLQILANHFPNMDITDDTIDMIFNTPEFMNQTGVVPYGQLTENMSPTLKYKINMLILTSNVNEAFDELVEVEVDNPSSPIYQKAINIGSTGITMATNPVATANFNEQLNKNPRIKTIFQNIFGRLNDLYVMQAGIMLKPFEGVTDDTFEGAMNTMVNAAKFGGFLVLGLKLMGVTGGISAIISLAGLLAYTPAILSGLEEFRGAIKNQFVQIVTDNMEQLKQFMNKIQYNYVNTMVRFIMKDPYFLSEVFDDSYRDKLRAAMNAPGVNCYNDFDINLVNSDIFSSYDPNNTQFNNLDFKFSPDFYLYNDDITPRRRLEYIKDQIAQKMSAGKINAFLVAREYKSIITRFNAIKDVVFEDQSDNAVYQNLISDMSIINNSSNSASTPTSTDAVSWDVHSALRDLRDVYVSLSENYTGTFVNEGSDAIDINGLKFNILNVARMTRLLELAEMQTAINEALTQQIKVQNASNLAEGINMDNAPEDDPSWMGRANAYTRAKFGQALNSVRSQFGDASNSDYGIVSNIRKLTLDDESTQYLKEFKQHIKTYFTDYYRPLDTLETSTTAPSTMTFETSMTPSLQSGTIQQFQTELHTKLNQLFILDSALADAAKHGEIIGNEARMIEEIPELSFLKWYNLRYIESTIQDTYLLEELYDSLNYNDSASNRKLFPTVKVYFVEEDRKFIRQLDDYYTYDAINSIDVVSNKSSAGKTAVLKLANVFNTLTDKMSLMTELLNTTSRSVTNTDDLFLGTLDVKPGTKMIIKMGYAADDKHLPVVFVGRITDMRPGPITEIIAQSYGAQLNHYIEYLNFGFASSYNERGDVAIAILDQIPSLEGMGKQDPFGGGSVTWSGTGLNDATTKVFKRFLISNLTDKVNMGLLAANNPRNDNLFLPVYLLSSIMETATFDWMVFQQSVWQAINEICLHSRNTYPIVKLYNNDKYSNLDELRETLVVGNKAGFYKFTDAFTLSSLDYEQIKAAVEIWNNEARDTFKNLLMTIIDSIDDNTRRQLVLDVGEEYHMSYATIPPSIRSTVNDVVFRNRTISTIERFHSDKKLKAYFTPEVCRVISQLTDKHLALILLHKATEISRPFGNDDLIEIARGALSTKHSWLRTSQEVALVNITALYRTDFKPAEPFFEYQVPFYDIGRGAGFYNNVSEQQDDRVPVDNIRHYNTRVLHDAITGFLRFLQLDPNSPRPSVVSDYKGFNLAIFNEDLRVQDLVHIKPPVVDNTNDELVGARNYKKIAKHHLVTDRLDILSNNVVVSENFANAVRVRYLDEPKAYNRVTSIPNNEQKKLRQFTVKAFGATPDDQTRVLESFQRNIDTNHFEIARDVKGLMQEYATVFKGNGVADENATGAALLESGANLKNLQAHWERLPAFVTVPISILQREVAKMYQGTIQLVGHPYIEPYDIVHIDDSTTYMHGAIEVEEVIHTFNPQQGFVTTITPNALTYDRNPIALSDVSTIQRILTEGQKWRDSSLLSSTVAMTLGGIGAVGAGAGLYSLFSTGFAAAGIAAGTVGLAIGGMGLLLGLSFFGSNFYDIFAGRHIRYSNFIYDSFANVYGRDCINFTALQYHDKPLMGGFGGVDYTNLTTLINQQFNNGPLLQRLASADDIESMWILGKGRFDNVGLLSSYALTQAGTPTLLKGIFASKVFGDLNSNSMPSMSDIGEAFIHGDIFSSDGVFRL